MFSLNEQMVHNRASGDEGSVRTPNERTNYVELSEPLKRECHPQVMELSLSLLNGWPMHPVTPSCIPGVTIN